MKKSLILFFVVFPLFLSAQSYEIPVKNGKVVFSETILTPKKADEIKNIVAEWLEEEFLLNRGTIVSVDTINNLIVARVTQPLEMEKGDWSQFVMDMRYTLVVEYKTNQCIITVNNIRFAEPKEFQDKNNPAVFTAESVLIDKNYKEAFIKNPIEKIELATVDHVEDLFFSIGQIL